MAGDYWIRYEEPEKTKKLLIELKNGKGLRAVDLKNKTVRSPAFSS